MTQKKQVKMLEMAAKHSLKALLIVEKMRDEIDMKYEPWETADYFNVLDDMLGTMKSAYEEVFEHLHKVMHGEVIE